MTPAVLFLVFNRPGVTAQVFEAIRKARPSRLYIAADGPRTNRVGELERCEEVRRQVTSVDWPCELKTLFRSENLGCGRAVREAINWFFQHETEASFSRMIVCHILAFSSIAVLFLIDIVITHA